MVKGIFPKVTRPMTALGLFQKDNGSDMEILSHWHPNITVNIVTDQTPWTAGMVPPPLDECKLALLSCVKVIRGLPF